MPCITYTNSAFQITPYHLIGWIGFLSGMGLNLFLANHLGYSLWIVAGYCTLSVAVFYTYAMTTKIIKGFEELVYYRYEVAMLVAVTVFLFILGKRLDQPVAAYLDLYILGMALFLFFGRLGCYLSGCCYGRPHACGKVHAPEHGYPDFLSKIPVLPTQVVESFWILCVAIIGITFLLDGHQPGEALLWHAFAYGGERFALEYFRGDKRPYLFGLSEAQWTTLLLIALVSFSFSAQIFSGALTGEMPSTENTTNSIAFFYQIAIPVFVFFTCYTIVRYSFFRENTLLNSANHLEEILTIVHAIDQEKALYNNSVHIMETSQKVKISGQRQNNLISYTFSCKNLAWLNYFLVKLGKLFISGRKIQSFEIKPGRENVSSNETGIFHLICKT